MSYVMGLTKEGDATDQGQWQIVTSPEDPRATGTKVGDVIHLDGDPDDWRWRVGDIFRG